VALSFARDIVGAVLLDAETISRRVAELGAEISRDYAGLEPVLVGVLRGTVFFLADLIRQITIPITVDFLAISSYSPNSSTGVVRITKDLDENIEGRHVLIIEDIIDTGLTLRYIVRTLEARRPASLNVCVLLDRPALRLVPIPVRYVGFTIPNQFVVGYGLDLWQKYRNLPYIAIVKREVLDGR
jgi:hypoxanthine phosphoribosyltransferase